MTKLEGSSPVNGGTSTQMPPTARGSLLLLFLCYTLNQLCGSIISFLAIPIKIDLQISDLEFGILAGPGFSIPYGIFAFLFAYFADRGNRVILLTGVLTLWSTATMCCGLTTSFWQLLAVRIAVAIGEAGGTPTTLAIASDSVPKARLSSTFAILVMSAPVAFLISAFAGSYFAERFGWRMTFVLCGALGIPIAILIKWKLRDPRFAMAPDTPERTPWPSPVAVIAGIIDSMRQVARRRSVVLILLAYSWGNYMGGVLPNWMPILLNRNHGYSGADAALYFGITAAAGLVPGLICGGLIADRLARISPLWKLNIGALALIFSVPLFIGAFYAQDARISLGVFAAGTFISQLGTGPTLGAFTAGLPSRVRATGTATLMLGSSLIAQGLGNFFVGGLSDLLAPHYGAGSLKTVLSIVVASFAAISLTCFLLARKTFARDIELAHATPAFT